MSNMIVDLTTAVVPFQQYKTKKKIEKNQSFFA